MTELRRDYSRSITWRIALLLGTVLLLPVVLCLSIAVGATSVPIREIPAILGGFEADPRFVAIVLNIRLPQALAAVLAGAGLAISGATMQGVLRNPLCSPFTLGISHAAAFGAALNLFLTGGHVAVAGKTFLGSGGFFLSGQGGTALVAFVFALLTTGLLLLLARFCGTRSESIILIGIALHAFFSAALLFLQYLSDDARLTAIVYWMFGDTARATWTGLALMAACIVPLSAYFLSQSWNYNALVFGEETALGLGVPVRRLRLSSMLFASLITAVLVSSLGVIGFIGLVVPHLARLLIGSDYRFLLPFSLLSGGLLLLIADTTARLMLAPRVLPVAILTAFIGVPVFLSLLLGKRGS